MHAFRLRNQNEIVVSLMHGVIVRISVSNSRLVLVLCLLSRCDCSSGRVVTSVLQE
jgi:hypothetical protein